MMEVKKIPEGWIETTLGNVINISSGKSRPKKQGVFPVYGGNGILDYADSYNYENATIIVGRVGAYCGCVYYEENKFWLSDNALAIKSNENSESRFLYYYLINENLNRIAIGGAQPLLTQGILNQIEIIVPKDIKEQKSIAQILNSFDDKIELLQAQNKTLETLAQTVFKEWFGKYTADDELPEGWSLGVIGDMIGELESGTRPKGGVGNIFEGIPSVGAESINGITNFDYSKTKYIPIDFFQKMNRGIVKDYDILIYKDGGTPGTFIPRFSIFGEGFPFESFAINEHVFRVQPKMDFQRFYLYNWLNSYYCKRQLQNIGGKAAIPGINSTDLKGLEMVIPPDEYLQSYDETIKSSYKKILTNMIQIQTLSKTRDALLPKLISGEIRVEEFKN